MERELGKIEITPSVLETWRWNISEVEVVAVACLAGRNALEVSATGFDQTISKFKANFSMNHM